MSVMEHCPWEEFTLGKKKFFEHAIWWGIYGLSE